MGNHFTISSPPNHPWSWRDLKKLRDTSIELYLLHNLGEDDQPAVNNSDCNSSNNNNSNHSYSSGNNREERRIRFQGEILFLGTNTDSNNNNNKSGINSTTLSSSSLALFLINPEIKSIDELSSVFKMTLNDLPKHSFQRDVLMYGDYLKSETSDAVKLGQLSKSLDRESRKAQVNFY
jgi:hypothetical protein